MLNYIWAGLIAFSLVFALIADGCDAATDTYRNGQPLPVTIRLAPGADPTAATRAAEVAIDPTTFASHYGVTAPAAPANFPVTLRRTDRGEEARFAADAALPAPLTTIRDVTASEDKQLRARVGPIEIEEATSAAVTTLTFEPVRFPKLRAITGAAIDFAKMAVTVAIGLIGILALWLGLMRIGERAGLIELVVRATQPLLRPLFPEIPPGHPAMGMIALNLTANMLGLGNAATPFGLKAMEELQKLNPTEDTATNSMVMLLALNTAGVQLVPPALLVAVMGLEATSLLLPILFVTFTCAVIAVIATRLLGRQRKYRETDPELLRSRGRESAVGATAVTTTTPAGGDA